MDEDVQARFGGSSSSSTLSVEKAILSPPSKVVITTENLQTQRKFHQAIKFTADENDFLKRGIDRHGYRQRMAILRDSDFTFQEGKTADSLKKRAVLKVPLV